MAETENEIVEFLDGDAIKLGLVLKSGSSRIQVTDQNGKQHSLNSRQIFLTHRNKASLNGFQEYGRNYLERVSLLSGEIDTELLWESLPGKGSELNPEQAAELYFGDSDAPGVSAVIRAALSDSLHFRQKGIHITIRDAEQVREQEHLLAKKEERQALNDGFSAWAAGILDPGSHPSRESHPEFLPLLNSLEQSLSNDEFNLEPWLQSLISRYSNPFRSRAEAIVELLVSAGRLPRDADPYILEAGVPLEFSAEALEESSAAALDDVLNNDGGLWDIPVFSIDDEETREIDDAVSVERIGDDYQVGIHISLAGDLIRPDSALDREAVARSTSVYLPHRWIRMLPEELSCGRLSLQEGRYRPVLSCRLRLNSEMEILEQGFSINNVHIDRNLTYDEADNLIRGENGPGKAENFAEALRVLGELTRKLMEERKNAGAIIIRRPETKISIDGERINIILLDPDSPSREIISELMILYNRLAAETAAANQIPFIFRSQEPPSRDIPEILPGGYDPYTAYKLFSIMEAGNIGLESSPHFGLGLSCYAQVTSPIRRLADLLNQRQLAGFLACRSQPYEASQLSGYLDGIEAAEKRSRNLERKTSRLFTLRYLLKEKPGAFDGVLLQVFKNGSLVETVPHGFRGLLDGAGGGEPGARLKMRISRIDPENDLLQFSLLESSAAAADRSA